MIILKFGGTSVSTRDRLQTICQLVRKESNAQPIVVVSAIRGVTDALLSLRYTPVSQRRKVLETIRLFHMNVMGAYWEDGIPPDLNAFVENCLHDIQRLSQRKKFTKSLQDRVVSYGEIMSSAIVTHALLHAGISAVQVIGTECIVTDDTFTNAEFLPKESVRKTKTKLLPLLKSGKVPVVAGFLGATINGETTTLGRGGSDYSAAILGYCMSASEIQIWTDVDGIYSADPRNVLNASLLSRVSYKEASELAAFGAKILHPRTLRPAVSAKIPVRVLNTLNPKSDGTLVLQVENAQARVAAVVSKNEVTMVNIYSTEMLFTKGFLVKIFSVFAQHNISVDLVSVSEVSVSVTLDNDDDLALVIKELEVFALVTTRKAGVVSVVGEEIVRVDKIMRNIFSLLDIAKIKLHMISFGASDINVSLVIDSHHVMSTVQLLHDALCQQESISKRSYL